MRCISQQKWTGKYIEGKFHLSLTNNFPYKESRITDTLMNKDRGLSIWYWEQLGFIDSKTPLPKEPPTVRTQNLNQL